MSPVPQIAHTVFGGPAVMSTRPAQTGDGSSTPAIPIIATGGSAEEPACSAAPAVATASPMKGLAQRLPAPTTSPGLLELSLAPEELVLVPSATASFRAGSDAGMATALSPSRLPFHPGSNQPIGSDRALSLPPQGASISATVRGTFGLGAGPLSSPRRALSAQPAPSPRRVPLPTKRDLSSAPSAIAVFGSTSRTATGTQGTGIARPPPSPRRVPGSANQCSTTTQSGLQSASNSGSVAPLLSTVAVNPTQTSMPAASGASSGGPSTTALQADGKAKHRALPVRVSARRVAALVSKPGADASIAPAYRAPPSLTPAQLGALTTKNTSFNKQQYNKHSVTVIHRDENRPPSPTSKIRKTMDSGAAATPKTSASGSRRSVQAADSCVASVPTSVVRDACSSDLPVGTKRPHYQGAGDEGAYTSPVKSSASDNDAVTKSDDGPVRPRAKRPRAVKWDRALLADVTETRTPRRAKARAAELLKQNKVYKVREASSEWLVTKVS